MIFAGPGKVSQPGSINGFALVGYSLCGTGHTMPAISPAYRLRKPQDCQYYQCIEDSLEVFLLSLPPKYEAAPGAVIAIQTFGDFLNFNPHCHALCTDGVFYGNGSFKVAPALDTVALEKIFKHTIFKMLLRKGKITEKVVKLIMSWQHSGFNIHCGPRIQPGDEEAMENLARYIVRASFSHERMTYLPDESQVVYRSKDGKNEKTFDALEWLPAMCSHVPNKGEQMVRYYGYYSNVSRGKRKKQDQDEWIPWFLEPDKDSKEYRKNWARLIRLRRIDSENRSLSRT
ncbi:MAG: transposase [Proteobacteria bacterium]|nr:transposase [Pseudomonadota bacterium]